MNFSFLPQTGDAPAYHSTEEYECQMWLKAAFSGNMNSLSSSKGTHWEALSKPMTLLRTVCQYLTFFFRNWSKVCVYFVKWETACTENENNKIKRKKTLHILGDMSGKKLMHRSDSVRSSLLWSQAAESSNAKLLSTCVSKSARSVYRGREEQRRARNWQCWCEEKRGKKQNRSIAKAKCKWFSRLALSQLSIRC